MTTMNEPVYRAVLDSHTLGLCLLAHGTSTHPPLPYDDRERCRCVLVEDGPGGSNINFGCYVTMKGSDE